MFFQQYLTSKIEIVSLILLVFLILLYFFKYHCFKTWKFIFVKCTYKFAYVISNLSYWI